MPVVHIWPAFVAPATLVAAVIVLCSMAGCFVLEEQRPDYSVYHNISALYDEITSLAQTYPAYLQVDHRFKSGRGLSQLVVRLANFSESSPNASPQPRNFKVRALLLFGQRGGDLVTVESALHFMHRLFAGLMAPSHTVEGALSRTLLSKVDLHIVVLANPDGRNYLERTGDSCFDNMFQGRSMDTLFVWDLEHRQTAARAETHVVLNLSQAQAFDAFVAFRSGVREIHLPFAGVHFGQSNLKPANLEAMTLLAKEVAWSVKPHFVYGQARDLMPKSPNGTAFDFMAGVRKVPFSLSIGLWSRRPGSRRFNCFLDLNPESKMLKQALEELHPLYQALFLHLINWKEQQSRSAFSFEHDGPSLLLCSLVLCIVIVMLVLFAFQHRLPDSMRFYPRRRIVSLKMLSSSLHSS